MSAPLLIIFAKRLECVVVAHIHAKYMKLVQKLLFIDDVELINFLMKRCDHMCITRAVLKEI